jgi:hypothetical protein
LIKVGAFKTKAEINKDFYKLGKSLGKTGAGKLEAFIPNNIVGVKTKLGSLG